MSLEEFPTPKPAPLAGWEQRYAQGGSEYAWWGNHAVIAYLKAAGECAYWSRMARGQVNIIRSRRQAGTEYPNLAADLRLYRRDWHYWRKQARELKMLLQDIGAL